VIEPPQAPEGVRSEFGFASDLVPGVLFRFVDGDVWFQVYDTFGCACGEGPWECIGCRGEQQVDYGRIPDPTRDYESGAVFCDGETITWNGFERPPEVEYVWRPTEKEKAELLGSTLPKTLTPSESESDDRE